jgi:hypothetical protein
MTNLFTFCLCSSLAQLAIYICINHQGMILHALQAPLNLLFEEHPYIAKPLYSCVICMASVYTAFFWFLVFGSCSFKLLFAILICAGINKLLCAYLEKNTDYGC